MDLEWQEPLHEQIAFKIEIYMVKDRKFANEVDTMTIEELTVEKLAKFWEAFSP